MLVIKIINLLLMLIIGIVLIVAFVQWYSRLCYRWIVRRPSEILDRLLQTGEVPGEWRRRWLEKIARGMKGAPGRCLRRWLMKRYARRMRGMISFVRGNHRISPEEARSIAMELRETAEDWLKCADLDELIGEA